MSMIISSLFLLGIEITYKTQDEGTFKLCKKGRLTVLRRVCIPFPLIDIHCEYNIDIRGHQHFNINDYIISMIDVN
jgi:hypothetical protein